MPDLRQACKQDDRLGHCILRTFKSRAFAARLSFKMIEGDDFLGSDTSELEVGKVVGEVVGEVADAVVPRSVLDRLHAFGETWLGGIMMTVLFIAVTVLLTVIVVRLINRFFHRTVQRLLDAGNASATAVSYLRYLALAAVYFTAISIIVSNIPALSTGFRQLFAAGGVLAVVVGFASQQAMGSIVSGFMILTFKPFVIGDFVNVISSSVSGTVEEITLRHTIIRTIENKRVIIPNDTMSSAIIENANHTEAKVCLLLDIGITYESDIARAMAILEREIVAHPHYYDNRSPEEKAAGAPPVVIRVQELADSAVVLRAMMWACDNGTGFAMKSDLMKSIKEACGAEGVDLAYPHLVVVNA